MAVIVPAIAGKVIHIGRAGENLATIVQFDVSDWLSDFGTGGDFQLYIEQGGGSIYPQSVSQEGSIISWEVKNVNTAIIGMGKCELQYIKENIVVKSILYDIVVTNSLDAEAAGDPPSAIESWLEEIQKDWSEIENAASYARIAGQSKDEALDFADDASNFADEAEQWAKGQINGVDVPSSHAGYHDNSKYFSEQSERWARGKINGQDVPSGQAGYQDNSKYYSLRAERWARGTENNTPVSSGDGYNNNAKYYAERIQSLQTGTVITGDPGTSASANVTLNTSNNTLTLNLTIPRGDQGNGIKIVGTKTSQSQLPSASSVEVGTAYGVGIQPPYDIYISTGNNWVNFGPIGGTVAVLYDWTSNS